MKKNNNGFSLVELIVVVLIMAIIAVALAPQVMKWVENSRVSTDVSNYDSMVANLQLAITDKNAYSSAMPDDAGYKVVIGASGTKMLKGTTDVTATDTTATDNIAKAMYAVDKSWTKIAKKTTGSNNINTADYEIEIHSGSVIKTKAPVATGDLS